MLAEVVQDLSHPADFTPKDYTSLRTVSQIEGSDTAAVWMLHSKYVTDGENPQLYGL